MATVNVICCDGGGVRGFYELQILKKIQECSTTPVKIDLIVGVSAGAMVGAHLALRMDKDEKWDDARFLTLARDIFHQKPTASLLTRPKYDGTAKKKALFEYFGERQFKDVSIPLCIVCATMDGGVANYCSWKKEHESLLIADILNASSAAPLYFPPVNLQGTWLTDGGIRTNKPLLQSIMFAWELFGKNASIHLLSIGTYFSSRYRFHGAKKAPLMGLVGWLKQGILQVLMGTQDTTTEDFCKILLGENFLRLLCMCDEIHLDDHGAEVVTMLKESSDHTFHNNKSKIAKLLNINFK